MNSDSFDEIPPNIFEWIEKAPTFLENHLSTQIKIVGIIGKDYPDHGKGEIVNHFLKQNIFPNFTEENEILSIRAHYSEEHQILFLLLNGADDVENLKSIFCTKNNSEKSFFEKLADSEDKQLRMLHFLFITCHFIILAEQTSRIDLEILRTFQKVNVLRSKTRSKIDKRLFNANLKNVRASSQNLSQNEREGRVLLPRLLIAVQRNNVRDNLSSIRKREVYEKLEKSLGSQYSEILAHYKLAEAGSDSLCQINSNSLFVHLLNPRVIQRDIIEEMFNVFLQNPESQKVPSISTNNSFVRFLEQNLELEKNTVTLESAINILKCLTCVLNDSIEAEAEFDIKWCNIYLRFEEKSFQHHINEAFRVYERDNNSRGNARWDAYGIVERNHIRTKTEHDSRFAEAVKYLKLTMGSRLNEALEVLEKKCNEIWQSDMRACEQISLTGVPCVLKVHPTFGDEACSENKWTAHDSSATLISTCACGKKQSIRFDPFTIKEANFDFYENNLEFDCCQKLEKFHFHIYQEDLDEKEEWNSWAGRESNSLIENKTNKIIEIDENVNGEITEEEEDDEESNEGETNIEIDVVSQITASSSESDEFYLPQNNRKNNENSFEYNPMISTKTNWKTASEFAKRLNALKLTGKNEEFIEGVPNTLTSGKLPLFPSWILTCLGDSSIYNHSAGVRSQPNFKIGGEYLTPVVVYIDCDINVWNRDVDRVRSEDLQRRHISKPKSNEEFARVKLFVGFEYECSRGHRFFVDSNGEPLLYSKGVNAVRESSQKSAHNEILNVDLPLRRACTCRKLPLKSAQLMKIHVITPKAPVRVTINPKIEVPEHSGLYQTGEEPLELENSKYYILQLPMVYSGPSGTYIHSKKNFEKIGSLKAGAIQVVHKPYLTLRW